MSKKIIAVANQKGGVGKNTTMVNLGAPLALIDLDPLANMLAYLGYEDNGSRPEALTLIVSCCRAACQAVSVITPLSTTDPQNLNPLDDYR